MRPWQEVNSAEFDFRIFNLFNMDQVKDILKVDTLAWQKNSKHHFFGEIGDSFHEVTHIGLEPYQFFFFLKYLNKYGC